MNDTRLAMESSRHRITEPFRHVSQFEYPQAATLTKNEVCACIEETGVLPSVNVASIEDAMFIADALNQAGIPIVEISTNAADAIEIISYLVRHAATTIVGGGNVRKKEIACKCLDAGAKFLGTDGLIPAVVELAVAEKVATVSGALTLTEVIGAWDAGADFVKVVPCHAVGGHNYIRTLKTSVPQARLIAAGGVTQLTAKNYVMAGAAALSLGHDLIPVEAVAMRQPRRIQELARRFLTAVENGRA